jgi:hypothetical protein
VLCCNRFCLGEVVAHLQSNKDVYALQDFLKLSLVGEPYQWLLCQFLMPFVVGAEAWNKKKSKELVGDVATCSDKAFVLLSLENNYERWVSEAVWIVDNMDKEPSTRANKDFSASLYTNSGQSQNNGKSRRLQGWAREGYLRFNQLYKLVEQDRFQHANFESELMALWQRQAGKGKSHVTVDKGVDEEDIFPANNLDGLEPPCANYTNDDDHHSETSDPLTFKCLYTAYCVSLGHQLPMLVFGISTAVMAMCM